MADVVLTRQQIARTGLSASFAAIDNVDTYYAPNDVGDVFLHFKNTGGSPSTVTFDITQTFAGVAVTDPTVSVPATTGDVLVGPFPAEWQDDAGANPGHIKFTQNQASGVTVACIRI